MTEIDYVKFFRQLARRFLGSALLEEHGVPDTVLDATETRLGYPIPASLRAFYSVAGRSSAFCLAHNRVLSPEKLIVDRSFLVFMEENQRVVTWGIPLSDLGGADPIPWQRVNTEPVEWYSEERPFSELMLDMYEWYDEIGLWNNSNPSPGPL